jgi:hypothetical protein
VVADERLEDGLGQVLGELYVAVAFFSTIRSYPFLTG